MAMMVDPQLMIAALKAQPQDGVIKPPDTGDDNVLPPDPGFMKPTSQAINVDLVRKALNGR